MSYYTRRQLIRDQLMPTRSAQNWKDVLRYNNKLSRETRQGEYLIKMQIFSYSGSECSYISHNYLDTLTLSSRRNAAWFKREELPEVLARLGKGFKVVKKSKNE